MIFPSALNYPEECESLSAERFGSATDPGEPAGYARPHDHNGFKNPWHLAHSRVPWPGDFAGRRYPDDRIGGRGSTGLHGAQRPGRDHLGGTPLGEHTLRYPRLPANAPRPRTSSRARDTGKIPVVQHSTPKKPLSGPKTALSAAQPGGPQPSTVSATLPTATTPLVLLIHVGVVALFTIGNTDSRHRARTRRAPRTDV